MRDVVVGATPRGQSRRSRLTRAHHIYLRTERAVERAAGLEMTRTSSGATEWRFLQTNRYH